MFLPGLCNDYCGFVCHIFSPKNTSSSTISFNVLHGGTCPITGGQTSLCGTFIAILKRTFHSNEHADHIKKKKKKNNFISFSPNGNKEKKIKTIHSPLDIQRASSTKAYQLHFLQNLVPWSIVNAFTHAFSMRATVLPKEQKFALISEKKKPFFFFLV